jgi:hypothetical protein
VSRRAVMHMQYRLFVPIFGLFQMTAITLAAAPVPKENPVLTCQLILTGGKIGDLDFPDRGEVVVTNTSSATIDIGTGVGPLGNLRLEATDPKRKENKKDYSTILSPFPEVRPHLLKPGASYRAPVGLMFAVPDEDRVPGTYKVKAVYTVKGQEAVSNVVEVKWPGPK